MPKRRPGWRTVCYWLLQWTWGLPQNLVGLALFLQNCRRPHYLYHGAVVTVWRHPVFSAGMGMFIFMSGAAGGPRTEGYGRLRVHEYGHTIQSMILGPLYLAVIWLPSFLWALLPRLRALRRRKRISYYAFYTERWANALGELAAREPSMGQVFVDI